MHFRLKRRIQHILLLTFLANLLLVLFQGYWLRSNYLVNQENFVQGIQEGLEEAVEQMMFGETKSIILLTDSISHPLDLRKSQYLDSSHFSSVSHTKVDALKVEVSEQERSDFTADTLSGNFSFQSIVQIKDSQAIGTANRQIRIHKGVDSTFFPEAQSLVQKVFMSFMDDNLNAEKLDSLYTIKKKKRLLKSSFELELYKQDSLIEQYQKGPVFKTAYRIDSRSGILPPGYSVRANFPRQTLYLLKKMGFAILISLLLVGIMIASFLYMLRIIFKQKQLAEIKNDFINNMTHELKTPISILSTANEALLNFDGLEDKKKTVRYLGIFQKELERLTHMVEKVLNVSIYEQETFSLKKETVNLPEMIQDLIQHHQAGQEKSIHIQFDKQLEKPTVKVDRIHFYNVLNNILDNAIKYSGKEVVINIKARESDQNILLDIQDQGIGIPKAHQKSVFDKFYRVPTGNLHNVKGFGLGLHYVKQIIDKHQGSIRLDSEEGRGTTFQISLPRL